MKVEFGVDVNLDLIDWANMESSVISLRFMYEEKKPHAYLATSRHPTTLCVAL